MEDWLDDLGEFAASVVAAAVQTWRRDQAKRPTPADIRRLCLNAVVPVATERPALAAPDHDAMDRANAERRRQWDEAEASREAWAREEGYANFAEGLAAGLTKTARYTWQRR